MDIKKILTHFLIIASNTSILFSESIENIKISKSKTGVGDVIYKADLPHHIQLKCQRNLRKSPEKPSCKIMPLGKSNLEETDWKYWYILQELFEIQEKKAKEEVERFEQEFEEMKKSIKSESELAENLTRKLFAELI